MSARFHWTYEHKLSFVKLVYKHNGHKRTNLSFEIKWKLILATLMQQEEFSEMNLNFKGLRRKFNLFQDEFCFKRFHKKMDDDNVLDGSSEYTKLMLIISKETAMNKIFFSQFIKKEEEDCENHASSCNTYNNTSSCNTYTEPQLLQMEQEQPEPLTENSLPEQHSPLPEQHSLLPEQHSLLPEQHSLLPEQQEQHSPLPEQHSLLPEQQEQHSPLPEQQEQHSPLPELHSPFPQQYHSHLPEQPQIDLVDNLDSVQYVQDENNTTHNDTTSSSFFPQAGPHIEILSNSFLASMDAFKKNITCHLETELQRKQELENELERKQKLILEFTKIQNSINAMLAAYKQD